MIIDTDTTITDICNQNIVVISNATLIVRGICSKKIILQSNSFLNLIGMCNELEITFGSSATITGTAKNVFNKGNLIVNGTIQHLEDFSKNTTINAGAIVNNVKH